MDLLDCKVTLTEEERTSIYEKLTGQKLDGIIDYGAQTDYTLIYDVKRKLVEEEMVNYLVQAIMQEFDVTDRQDAFLKWEEYKERHNITLKE